MLTHCCCTKRSDSQQSSLLACSKLGRTRLPCALAVAAEQLPPWAVQEPLHLTVHLHLPAAWSCSGQTHWLQTDLSCLLLAGSCAVPTAPPGRCCSCAAHCCQAVALPCSALAESRLQAALSC